MIRNNQFTSCIGDLSRAQAIQVAPSRPEPLAFLLMNVTNRRTMYLIEHSRSRSCVSLTNTLGSGPERPWFRIDSGRDPPLRLLTGGEWQRHQNGCNYLYLFVPAKNPHFGSINRKKLHAPNIVLKMHGVRRTVTEKNVTAIWIGKK